VRPPNEPKRIPRPVAETEVCPRASQDIGLVGSSGSKCGGPADARALCATGSPMYASVPRTSAISASGRPCAAYAEPPIGAPWVLRRPSLRRGGLGDLGPGIPTGSDRGPFMPRPPDQRTTARHIPSATDLLRAAWEPPGDVPTYCGRTGDRCGAATRTSAVNSAYLRFASCRQTVDVRMSIVFASLCSVRDLRI
jgi:hypothetical protein